MYIWGSSGIFRSSKICEVPLDGADENKKQIGVQRRVEVGWGRGGIWSGKFIVSFLIAMVFVDSIGGGKW